MTDIAIQSLHNHLRNSKTAALGTLMPQTGNPYVSLVNFSLSSEGFPLLLLSNLAWHTQNLLNDARGSLLLADVAPAGDALVGQRMTIAGSFVTSDREQERAVYLKKHPEAEVYIDFKDFGFWKLQPTVVHVVAGFGRIKTYEAGEIFAVPF